MSQDGYQGRDPRHKTRPRTWRNICSWASFRECFRETSIASPQVFVHSRHRSIIILRGRCKPATCPTYSLLLLTTSPRLHKSKNQYTLMTRSPPPVAFTPTTPRLSPRHLRVIPSSTSNALMILWSDCHSYSGRRESGLDSRRVGFCSS